MFIGEAGAGKSTLLGALMDQPVAAAAQSTILADTKQVKCKWTIVGTNEDGQWSDLTEEDEMKELAILAKKVIKNKESSRLKNLTEALAAKVFKSSETNFLLQNDTCNRSFQEEADELLSLIMTKSQEIVSSLQELPSYQYVNVWDCGGQRVFLDVLPAFLTSRTMFCLIFDASKDLQERIAHVWNQDGTTFSMEAINLKREDLLIQWMTCINASLSNKAQRFYEAQFPQDNVAMVPPFPGIMVIGTHGDLTDPQKKKAIVENFQAKCKNGKFFDQMKGIEILDTTKRGRDEDPAVMKIKQVVRQFISEALTIPTPTAWVLFRKLFTKLTKSRPVVTINNTAIISRACFINDEILCSVLSFYHELGALFHFADIEKLKDVVIAQPEWLVKHLGTILAPKECGKSSVGPRGAWNLLRENGILVEALYRAVWKTSISGCKVDPQGFADLLEHFSLIAEVTNESLPTVPGNYGRKYFMPCVLPVCPDDGAVVEPPPDAILSAAPLHLTFSTHYVPPGFFVRLATVLTKNSCGFKIAFKQKLYSNQITFQYEVYGPNGNIDDVILSQSKRSICVNVTRRFHCEHVEKCNFPSTCRSILKAILGAAHQLYQWFPSIQFTPQFRCECSRNDSSHFTALPIENESTTPLHCEYDTISFPTPNQQFWMKIPASMYNEGILYESEIHEILENVDKNEMFKALEIEVKDSRDYFLHLSIWSKKMGHLGRSHLAYHLHRIGMFDVSKRIAYPTHTSTRDSSSPDVQMYTVVTDEEMIKCCAHIGSDADLSSLAVLLGISPENTTNPPRHALAMLKLWQQQNKSQAYKKTLVDILTGCGESFEKATRALNRDGAELPTMNTLIAIVEECAPNWYTLGLHLDIPDSALLVIEHDTPSNCQDATRKMLQKWLESCPRPTWRCVISALKKMNKNSLAEHLEKQYF